MYVLLSGITMLWLLSSACIVWLGHTLYTNCAVCQIFILNGDFILPQCWR